MGSLWKFAFRAPNNGQTIVATIVGTIVDNLGQGYFGAPDLVSKVHFSRVAPKEHKQRKTPTRRLKGRRIH